MSSHLHHWRLVQNLYRHFWIRWSREYLHTLQQLTKWQRLKANLKEDDLVLILGSTILQRGRWPLGSVLAVHPGKDGLVRAATIRAASGTYTRPVTKLTLLPISSSPTAMAGGNP